MKVMIAGESLEIVAWILPVEIWLLSLNCSTVAHVAYHVVELGNDFFRSSWARRSYLGNELIDIQARINSPRLEDFSFQYSANDLIDQSTITVLRH
jgi:hypothetical protein